jgi:hypothetical protein
MLFFPLRFGVVDRQWTNVKENYQYRDLTDIRKMFFHPGHPVILQILIRTIF